jgi:hypothetical protein
LEESARITASARSGTFVIPNAIDYANGANTVIATKYALNMLRKLVTDLTGIPMFAMVVKIEQLVG